MRKARRKRRSIIHRSVKTIAILGLSLTFVAGCSAMKMFATNEQVAGQEQTLTTVKTVKLAKLKIGESPEQLGEVMPSLQFEVLAKASGEVVEVLKKRGDTVQEGDIMVKLVSSDLLYERDKAALSLKTAQDSLNKAKRELENQNTEMRNAIQKAEQGIIDLTRSTNKLKNDYDAGLAKKSQVDQAESQLKAARLDLDLLKQRLKALDVAGALSGLDVQLQDAMMAQQRIEQAISDLEVKSPASGILTDLPLERGMSLQKGSRVGILQKLDPVKIKSQLPEIAANLVRKKSELTFYIPGSTDKTKGKITYMSTVIDPQTKAYELNLEVPNPNMALKPGMKTRVQLMDDQDQIVIAVPTGSIVKKGEDSYVFVVEGGTAERRKVELGRLSDNEVNQEILFGVKEGDRVVVSGQNQLKDKEKVIEAGVETQKQ